MKAFVIKRTDWTSSKDANNKGTTLTVRCSGRVFTASSLDFVDDEGNPSVDFSTASVNSSIELGDIQRVKGDMMDKLVPKCAIDWD